MLFWQISSAFSPGANLVPLGKILLAGGWELCINDRAHWTGRSFHRLAKCLLGLFRVRPKSRPWPVPTILPQRPTTIYGRQRRQITATVNVAATTRQIPIQPARTWHPEEVDSCLMPRILRFRIVAGRRRGRSAFRCRGIEPLGFHLATLHVEARVTAESPACRNDQDG